MVVLSKRFPQGAAIFVGLVIRCFVADDRLCGPARRRRRGRFLPNRASIGHRPSHRSRTKAIFLPFSFALHAWNIGSNSLSSSCSLPMEGQPNATALKASIWSAPNSAAVSKTACAPACLAPSGHLLGHLLCVARTGPIHNCYFTHHKTLLSLREYVRQLR